MGGSSTASSSRRGAPESQIEPMASDAQATTTSAGSRFMEASSARISRSQDHGELRLLLLPDVRPGDVHHLARSALAVAQEPFLPALVEPLELRGGHLAQEVSVASQRHEPA